MSSSWPLPHQGMSRIRPEHSSRRDNGGIQLYEKEAQERVERSLVSWVSQCRKMVDSGYRCCVRMEREREGERGGERGGVREREKARIH